ncbi:M20/M25/M40 family metallo-hydrolase [Bacillus sp. DJP31]|uniref:M20/M25/M40 family metallo-hydrolase n=1 Tax=Bacillus sp. DJP31 TaxID=3409789 RepID=UPI003BB66D35
MKNWNQLFIRQGFMVQEESANVFVCWKETEENMTFLLECLQKLSISYAFEKGILTITTPVITEEKWLECVDYKHRGRGESLWFRPGKEEPKVKELDTYIAGMVRQLNRLGLHTEYCCDGHERQGSMISFAKWVDMESVTKVLCAAGLSRFHTRNRQIRMSSKRQLLLDATEKLNNIQKEWVRKDLEFIRKQLFLNQLEQSLSINGESENEESIRQFVIANLCPYVDYLTVDHKGNVLAQKVCGNGHGPSILLNAHLDTVDVFEEGRIIMKDGPIWSSSRGILGADDRAGVTILLQLAERLSSNSFNGKVKFIFTVEEEMGLIGASNIDDYFLWDVDAAFVVDRRGTGDIVTSCGGYIPFCDESYGLFIEETAINRGLSGWKCTKGGSSDTRIWAAHGIQSVNLSVGYQREHTSEETLDTDACYNTLELLIGVFQQSRELKRVLQRINNQNNRIPVSL